MAHISQGERGRGRERGRLTTESVMTNISIWMEYASLFLTQCLKTKSSVFHCRGSGNQRWVKWCLQNTRGICRISLGGTDGWGFAMGQKKVLETVATFAAHACWNLKVILECFFFFLYNYSNEVHRLDCCLALKLLNTWLQLFSSLLVILKGDFTDFKGEVQFHWRCWVAFWEMKRTVFWGLRP